MDRVEAYHRRPRIEIPFYQHEGLPYTREPLDTMIDRERYNTQHQYIARPRDALSVQGFGHRVNTGSIPYEHLMLEPRNFPQLFNSEYRSHFINKPSMYQPCTHTQNRLLDGEGWSGEKPWWF